MRIDVEQAVLGSIRRAAPRLAPLKLRKALAKTIDRIPGRKKEALIVSLLHDWSGKDPAAYHQFIWSNHLSYAQYYDFRDIEESRGTYFERMHPLRIELLEMVATDLRTHGVAPESDVRSLLDVGSSLGYLPRYAETTAFPAAERLLGLDIDETAIAAGARYLQSVGSSVELRVANLQALETVLGDECFDVVTCTGVLQYLQEHEASHAVGVMLGHASKRLALSGLVSAEVDNASLDQSVVRGYDRSFVHNFDRMIEAHGGTIVARRWGGPEIVEGLGVYLVVATPG